MRNKKANNSEFIRLLLTKAKEKHGLKQYQIAERLNTKPSVVSKWMNEDTKPYDNTIFDIAQEFGFEIIKHHDGNFYFKAEIPKEEPQSNTDMYLSDMIKELNAPAEKVDDEQVASRIKQLTFEISNRFSKIMERNELLIANQLRIMNK